MHLTLSDFGLVSLPEAAEHSGIALIHTSPSPSRGHTALPLSGESVVMLREHAFVCKEYLRIFDRAGIFYLVAVGVYLLDARHRADEHQLFRITVIVGQGYFGAVVGAVAKMPSGDGMALALRAERNADPLSRFDRIARLCASLGLCFASDFFRIVVHDIPPLCAAMPPSLLLTAMVCGAGAEYSCTRCGIRKKSGGEVCRVKISGILHCRSITNIYGTERKKRLAAHRIN